MNDASGGLFAAVARFYRLGLLVLSLPVLLGELLRPSTGAEHGVGLVDKLVLVARMIRNNRSIPTGSSFVEHLVVATKILSIPTHVEGSVVECGCYKGGSTANLSLAAALADRTLAVFDSFEGMPEPEHGDHEHALVASEQVHTYETGAWRATYDEARANVGTYGDLSACEFHPGPFDETLPGYDEPVALAFLDVGLRASAEDAVEFLWPRLGDGCYLFTHEAKHMEVAALFYDRDWWDAALGERPPGLVGAGSGLGLHPGANGFSSLLAYTVKHPETLAYPEVADDGVAPPGPSLEE